MKNLITEKLNVNSEAVDSMIYNYELNTLKVKFNYGKEYMYFKVPVERFISMKYSESIGKFFNAKVRNQYTHA